MLEFTLPIRYHLFAFSSNFLSEMEKYAELMEEFGSEVTSKVHLELEQQRDQMPEFKDNRTALNMKQKTVEKVKKVGVRIRPSDDLGAAPLPEGYLTGAAQQGQPTSTYSISAVQRRAMAEESRPYEAPRLEKKSKNILRAGGGEVWEDPTLAYWDEGLGLCLWYR